MESRFIFFFVLTSTAAYGQTMMLGVRGGVNIANQEWTGTSSKTSLANISWRPGVLAGGQFEYQIDDSWVASIQFLYDQKGAHSDQFGLANGPLPGPDDWAISYIEIPLLAKVSFGNREGAVRPYFFAGPSIGFLLSNIETHNAMTANITDSTAKIDFSIVAGAGISHTLSSGTMIFLDAGYAFGLINTDNYYYDKVNGLSIYSRDIRIAAGILFPL